MANNRIKKIEHRHEEEAIKKWLWWLNAVGLVVSAGLTMFLTRLIFSADLFLIDSLTLTFRILVPLLFFGLWVMFAHLLALNSPTKAIWGISGTLGLMSFLALTPIFALIACVVVAVANASFMLAMRSEYHNRIRVSPFQNVEKGIHIFLDATFILIALGIFILYGTALGQKGLQIPEPLLERTVEQALTFSGIKVTLTPEITFKEVIQQVADQVSIPNVRDQLVTEGQSSAEISKYLIEHNQEILDETKAQFFGKLGIEGNYEEKFTDVVQTSLVSATKKNLPLPVEIALPGIFALALYVLLRTFAFVFIWVGQGFAWVWFHLVLALRLVKIERRNEEVELVRF